MNESKSMKEIHEIRRNNYDETKNMSREEYIKHIKNKASKSIIKISGYRYSSNYK